MHILLAAMLLALAGAWPVDDPIVTEGFDPPERTWLAGHRGIDLASGTGGRVYAIAAGTVSYVGTVAGKRVVTVSHGVADTGLRSTYEPVVPVVHVGQAVLPGALLGYVAPSGGHCGGAEHCVHVGLRTSSTYLDPRTLIGREPPILKPTR